MKFFLKFIATMMVAIGLIGIATGCGVFSSADKPVETQRFHTLESVWAVAHSTYQGYCELAVQGRVSSSDQKDIDTAWNHFRAAYSIAVKLSEGDPTLPVPDNVEQLKDDLIILIRSL